MSHTYFVNRHGKKLDIESAVDEIENQTVVKPAPVQQLNTISKPRRLFPKLRISKKVVLVLVILIVAIAASALLVADSKKRDYLQQTAAMKTSVKNISSRVSSTETSAKDAIKGITSQLTAPTTCAGSNNFVTTVYSPAKQAADECIQTATLYTKLKTSLAVMNNVVTYLDMQKGILAVALAGPSDGAYAEIPAEASTWKDSYDKLLKITPPTQAAAVYQLLVGRVKSVVDGWSGLSTAQNAQDASAFTAAETNLTKAYENLRTSGDDFNQVLLSLQKDVQTNASSLR